MTMHPDMFLNLGGRLIVASPSSRRNDPDTSKKADKEITSDGSRAAVLNECLVALMMYPDHTSQEIAKKSGIPNETMHKRLSDLKTIGAAEVVTSRRCEVTGKTASVWRAIEKVRI